MIEQLDQLRFAVGAIRDSDAKRLCIGESEVTVILSAHIVKLS